MNDSVWGCIIDGYRKKQEAEKLQADWEEEYKYETGPQYTGWAGFIAIIIGIVVLAISGYNYKDNHIWLIGINIGSLFIFVGLVLLSLFCFFTPDLLENISSRMYVKDHLASFGIKRITDRSIYQCGNRMFKLSENFENSRRVDFLLTHKYNLLSLYDEFLEKVLSNKNHSIYVYLPNPKNLKLIGQINHDFYGPKFSKYDDIKYKLDNTIKALLKLKSKCKGSLFIKFVDFIPKYNITRFTNSVMVEMHGHDYLDLSFICNRTGLFAKYIDKELSYIDSKSNLLVQDSLQETDCAKID